MKQLTKNQDGLASIIIVTVIISVVTLITIGFATIIRREQRQALDQQLSAQARLAAESAINEVIAQYRINPGSVQASTTCDNQGPTFSDAEEIRTTCVQVNPAPGPLEYDEIKTSESTLVWLDSGDTPIDRIVITWQNIASVESNSCLPSDYTLLPTDLNWDGSTATDRIGMLRFDLSRVGLRGQEFSRASMTREVYGGVLYPTTSNPVHTKTMAFGSANQPVIFGGCGNAPAGVFADGTSGYMAYAVIELPNDPNLNLSRYMLRLRSIYRPSAVKVIGFDTADRVVEFVDTQISLEATARVNDVVQRIQVRLPAGTPPRELIPDDAIHVTNGGVCKLIQTDPISQSQDNCNNLSYVPAAPSPPAQPPANPPPVSTTNPPTNSLCVTARSNPSYTWCRPYYRALYQCTRATPPDCTWWNDPEWMSQNPPSKIG